MEKSLVNISITYRLYNVNGILVLCLSRWRNRDEKLDGYFRWKRHITMSWKQFYPSLVHTEKKWIWCSVHQWFWHEARSAQFSVHVQNHNKSMGPQHGNEKHLGFRRRILRVCRFFKNRRHNKTDICVLSNSYRYVIGYIRINHNLV